MADKVYVTRDGSGAGLGLIAGILAVLLIGLGLLLATGGLRFDRNSGVNVNVEAPKAAPSPGGK